MRFLTTRPVARLAASAALAGTLGLSGGAALAQDATPAATPIDATRCVVPVVTDFPEATPAAVASPVAAQDAPLPEGTAVEDDAVVAEASAVIENLYACFNGGDGQSVVAFFTDTGLNAAYGAGTRDMIAEQVTALASAADAHGLEIAEVVEYDDGRLGVTYQVSINQQVLRFTDVLMPAGSGWLIDDRVSEAAETELDSTTAAVRTTEEDGSLVFEIAPNPIANQPAVRLQLNNLGENTHHFHLFQVPEGFDGSQLVDTDLSSLPEGVTFIGSESVMAGGFSDTLFEGLGEGNYVIVGYIIESSGERIGAGTAADLTVDPPFDPSA